MTDKQLYAMKRRMDEEWSRAYAQTKTEDFDFRSGLMAKIEAIQGALDEERMRRTGQEHYTEDLWDETPRPDLEYDPRR